MATATTFKKNTLVQFRTRRDRPLMRGTVKRANCPTAKGPFVQIRGDDGVDRRVRPAYITALA